MTTAIWTSSSSSLVMSVCDGWPWIFVTVSLFTFSLVSARRSVSPILYVNDRGVELLNSDSKSSIELVLH